MTIWGRRPYLPIYADVNGTVIYDGFANQDRIAERVDISSILIEMLGDDGERAADFCKTPSGYCYFNDELAEHPDVMHSESVSVSGEFDLARQLDPKLDRDSDIEDIAEAWTAWYDSAMAAAVPVDASKARWERAASELEQNLSRHTFGPGPIEAFARALLANPDMVEAILASAREPKGDPVQALRTCSSLEDALCPIGRVAA
jgi:hypothetical protein